MLPKNCHLRAHFFIKAEEENKFSMTKNDICCLFKKAARVILTFTVFGENRVVSP